MQTPRCIFVLVWLGFMAVAPAQYHYSKKDVVFAQVVLGGGFETVVSVVNRGRSEYAGTLHLFRLDNSPWNPAVNGIAVKNGEYAIKIPSGTTVAFRLTGSQLESGGAILRADDLRLDNLIEANLTYRVLEDSQASDSVGIAPSVEFYRAAIPFENFSEVGLALVNGGSSGDVTANVDLILFSAAGEKLQTTPVTLAARSHRAQFLHEFFPHQALEGGKVEIASDFLIFGTALTLSDGGFSSLPLEPAPTHYSVRLESQGHFANGDLVLWAEASFVRGYLAITALDDEAFDDLEFSLVNGQLEGGRLRLAFTVRQDPFFVEEVTLSLGHDQFSFSQTVVSGDWIELFPDETILKGRYEFTRRDDG